MRHLHGGRARAGSHELALIARASDAAQYNARRRTVERRAMAELVVLVAPPSHADLARAVLQRDAWGFLTPAASRGNHVVALQEVHPDLVLPVPLWPSTVELAALVGVAPAQIIGNNVAMLTKDLVDLVVLSFMPRERTSEAAKNFNAFMRAARLRRDAVLLSWDDR